MLNSLVLGLALAQQQAPSLPLQAPPSPVTRIVVTPSAPRVAAGDSLQLSAQAFDAAGRPVDAIIRFGPFGGAQEADVHPNGLVIGGAPAVIPAGVMALVQGTRPVFQRFDIRVVPGPAARVDILNSPERMVIGQRAHLGAEVFSASGDPRADTVSWTSSAPAVARVSSDGVISAVAPGRATLTATALRLASVREIAVREGSPAGARRSFQLVVVPARIASLEVSPDAPRVKQGDVIRFRVVARDAAGRAIAGLSPTWTMSNGTGMLRPDGAFVGYEPGNYLIVATIGARTAEARVTVAPREVRRPVTVVGRLPRTLFNTEEVWLHPNGRTLYLGTGAGGDRLYVIDVADPTKPRVTDSVLANTRRVDDVMTTPDGKTLVFTREGSSDRKDGIVIADLTDPAHPKPIAEYTEGVTGGVHSAFIYRQEKFGTHVYLTNDVTGALHIVDISDPRKPREVARWRIPRADQGLTLHDVDVRDGLAYLSYWNEGLVILDVGNGMKGGSPSSPTLVSRLKYDFDAIYRDVIASGGRGYMRGTHTAWRYGNYIFLTDEVWPASAVQGAKDLAAGRAYGRMHVVDVSDIERPRIVAWYEPDYGGAHYLWTAGDTLYLGAYQAGLRVFDISGELMGDLRAQGREIAHLNTADRDGHVVNSPMTWGVVVRDGLAYVNDMHNGLWIVRIEPPAVGPIP